MTYRLQYYDRSGRPTRYRNYTETWVILRDGREIMGGSMSDMAAARKACRKLNKEPSHESLR